MKVNYHTHSNYCDGKGALEDYVLEAIKRGFSSLGFSGHAPIKEANDWTMANLDVLKNYLDRIDRLKVEFEGEIRIYKGLEIDYYPDENRFDYFKKFNLDYCIGSLHMLYVDDKNYYCSVDESVQEFKRVLLEDFNSSIENFVRTYYRTLRDMIKQGGFDILGHFDLIKKFNKDFSFFTEKEDWYIDEVMKTLDLIENTDLIVEVNTGALSRGVQDTPYPSKWILRECYRKGIKVCLNSDVHAPENIECFFPEALNILRDVGYKRVHTPFEIINIEV